MKQKFEDIMAELDVVVKKLESGDASLEESLELFEKGIGLSKQCQKMLDDAENKVSVLLKDSDGNITKTDFKGGEQD